MTRRTSRKRTSLRRNSYTSTPAGKKVVMAFLDKRSADSAKLRTDGKRLDGLWMGGRGIAEWVGDKIVLHDLGSRSAQTIQNIIRREAPANWLKANVGRRTSRHDRGRRSSRATRRTSLRHNTSLVKQGADASAMALITRIEKAVGSGAYDVAHVTFERLDEWKRRYGAWPFDAKRYWRAVEEMQRGSQASIQRNSYYHTGDPKPKFKLGDRVRWMNGRKVLDTGEVSFVGDYDAYLGQYRYKMTSDRGNPRHFRNEESLRLVKGRKLPAAESTRDEYIHGAYRYR